MAARAPRIGLTAGCPAGIGPSVLARALALTSESATFTLFGTDELLDRMQATTGVDVRARVTLAPLSGRYALGAPGAATEGDLALQRDALLAAIDAARVGQVDALVTGPVRKKALVVDGHAWPGQTELIGARGGGTGEPLMIFAGGPFLLGLATVHVPLRDVSANLTPARVDRGLGLLADAARRIVAKENPRVVVLGINPHAGEGGLLGREEIDVLEPALARARAAGMDVRGPLPADGFFADVARGAEAPDAVLAMHHDQGLAPYKLLARGEGVNVTWGARVIRTSPDHGTADALAATAEGTLKASPLSMQRALTLAIRLTS